MIQLENVTLLKPGFARRSPILRDTTTVFKSGERIGILASPGSGKSSIARLLAGIDQPDFGKVRHSGRVSWPIGFAGFLHPELTVSENIRMLARLVGVPTSQIEAFCCDTFGFANLDRTVMKNLSPTQRALLSYACAMSVDAPATWIADETITVGEPRDRKICDQILADRLDKGGLIFLSRNARQLALYCDRFLVLLNHRLVPCDDLKIAQQALDLAAETARKFERSPSYA